MYAKHFWDEFQNLKSFDFEIETDQMDYERKGLCLLFVMVEDLALASSL